VAGDVDLDGRLLVE